MVSTNAALSQSTVFRRRRNTTSSALCLPRQNRNNSHVSCRGLIAVFGVRVFSCLFEFDVLGAVENAIRVVVERTWRDGAGGAVGVKREEGEVSIEEWTQAGRVGAENTSC
ncbi:hypothetical protein KCU81_g197, partial [Aureobasidium melanogenum]